MVSKWNPAADLAAPLSRARACTPATTQRLDRVEALLATGRPMHSVVRQLREEGLSSRSARRYVSLAFARWRQEAGQDRDAQRDRLRATLWAAYGEARAKTRVVLDAKGGEHEYPDPDMRTATAVLELLARLDGLITTPNALTINAAVGNDAIKSLAEFFIGKDDVAAIDAGANGHGRNG